MINRYSPIVGRAPRKMYLLRACCNLSFGFHVLSPMNIFSRSSGLHHDRRDESIMLWYRSIPLAGNTESVCRAPNLGSGVYVLGNWPNCLGVKLGEACSHDSGKGSLSE